MSVTRKEWTVPATGGRPVRIERVGDDVTVHWVCGASRTFAAERLRQALEDFDLAASLDGVRFQDVDSRASGYFAWLENGKFLAHDTLTVGANSVSWTEFRKALDDAVAGLEPEAS